MNQNYFRAAFLISLACVTLAQADDMNLGDLGADQIQQDWGLPLVNKSVDGHPLTIAGITYNHGIGTHASSYWIIDTHGRADHFKALVGIDDEVKSNPDSAKHSVIFQVVGDDKILAESKPLRAGNPPATLEMDLKGIQNLELRVDPTGSNAFCHADWVNAVISYTGDKPSQFIVPTEPKEVLTPKAQPAPRITSAKVVGVHPMHPLLFRVAATGDRPMKFNADDLPTGLTLDAATGQISGSVNNAGKYSVKVHASNALGTADGDLRIEVGDKIALTPQMGWNSWNCFASAVSDEKVRAAADAMVSSGLINHGWTYINIDDCWEIKASEPASNRRAADGHILTNKKFPDMKALADYIHSKGLRVGLYSSPGPATCGNYTASYQFEEADAHQYAQWGFDYLKYDWCSYDRIARQIQNSPNPPTQLEINQHPYAVMADAIKKQDRDILFSFCQYGMGNVWEWGEKLGGNSWRTTGDIVDSWRSMAGIGFSQNGHEKFAGPGHWNDPDMLVVGMVGWGPSLHASKLTPNEQYTHISLWSLLSSPLLIGCDMTQMDDFTVGLLTNDEVIAVNQDPLGKPAGRVSQTPQGYEVWARDLEDGSKAVGLFNRSHVAAPITVKWSDLNLHGNQKVRDLWRQKDLGSQADSFTATVPRHGVLLLKVSSTND